MRSSIANDQRNDICERARGSHSQLLFTGIRKVLVENPGLVDDYPEGLVSLLKEGKIGCLAEQSACLPQQDKGSITEIANFD
jgi:hypothetical protein